MTRYHQVSGGVGSWLAAKVDMEANPAAEHRFVFADTLYEDADCYRFLLLGICNLLRINDVSWVPAVDDFPDYRVDLALPIEEYGGNPEWREFLGYLRMKARYHIPSLDWLVEGRDIWEIMRDERMLGNSRIDPCSKIAKRQFLDKWQRANCNPVEDLFTIGIGPHEEARYTTLAKRKLDDGGWVYTAPLIGTFAGEVYRAQLEINYLRDAGLTQPRLYVFGYVHNNCGGFCIKAGHSHWLNRLRMQPERFAYDAGMERKLVAYIGGKAYSILSDRRGDNIKKPLTLIDFAARYKDDPAVEFEMVQGESGCGCMVDYQ